MTSWGRGATAEFGLQLYDGGTGAPLSPDSVTVEVRDPDGAPVAAPPASEVSPGSWLASWVVPMGAALGGWSVWWSVDHDGETRTAFEEFTVAAVSPLPEVEDLGVAPMCVAWCSSDDLPCDLEGHTEEQITRAIMAASESLWLLSGARYGVCDLDVWPCPPVLAPPGWNQMGGPWKPLSRGRSWLSTCTHGVGSCPCSGGLLLPPLPGVAVKAVYVDEVALPADAWEVRYTRSTAVLVRTDGNPWPPRNSFTGAGSWRVTLRWGEPVPYLGAQAAPILACQYLLAYAGDPACQLPERVQTVSRLGETMTFLDPMDFLTEGRIGIYLADQFLAAVNPGGLRSQPSLWSPDVSHGVTR